MTHDTTENETNIPETPETSEPSEPSQIPEKFRDSETGKIKTEALMNSYLALERKLSAMMPRPETDEDEVTVMRMMGMPETPDEYEINVDHGLFDIDPEMNSRMHEKKFTLDQVQMVYDLAAEKLVPMILELTDDLQADREVDRLVEAFGGPEKWTEISRQLLAFGKKNLSPDVLENLAGSFEGVMALHRMMKGEEPAMASTAENTSATTEGDLRGMMRDPRYWRDKDPAFVAKVTEGFQRMFGNE